MNVRYLEIFRAVMQTGSTLAAAELLSISQPAVSNQLRLLESQIGFSLFDRRSRRLVPTAEAHLFYERSRSFFEVLQSLDVYSEELRRGERGRLNFVCSPSLANGRIPEAIRRFHRDRSDVTLRLDMPSNERIIAMILAEMTEFGLTITPLEHPSLESSLLAKLPIYCVLPKNHALSKRAIIKPAELEGENLIAYPKHSEVGRIIDSILPVSGRAIEPFAEVRYISMALRLAEATLGIALVDGDTALAANPDLVAVRPVETDQFLPLVATHLKGQKLSLIAESFIADYIKVTTAQPG
ncbi:LysR family transcriptional regulator [Puniceibacterium sp. IMCC21224]|uniref:LysR family transcriptional regulator n=1 Tax=Puniceibacterium sp. IMCC21224 TaxID=1618204 RepID=UPI00064D93C1|nr:LysR family transcriptional regulator [Puniceibacterium sp. IMCC21224]KMK66540.1 transcriptional regulator [Puniceibacterium sp. IMCC21224]